MRRYFFILISFSLILISCTDVELEENCIVNEANQNEKIEAVVMINDEVLNDEAINQVIITQHIFAPGYESFEEMVESSDLIIRGHVLDERLEWFNTNITLEAAINARTEEYEAGLISRELLDIEIEHYHNNLEDFEPSYEYVIFYRIEILEIFQGEYEVGDVIELREFMGRDEEWNQSLEHSKRYEVDTELIFFLRRSRNLGSGYFVFFPHQAVYELPIGLRYETSAFDEHVLLKPLDVFQPEPLEVLEGYVIICDGFHAPFDINLNMLREIAEENGIAN